MSKEIKASYFALLFSFINLVLYHYPFFKFVFGTIDVKSLNGILLLISLIIAAILANAFFFYLVLFLLRKVGKWLMALFFIINAIAVYFVNTYGVIIDETMIGNVLNTNYEESSSFFSFGLVLYVILIGIIPSILLFKIKFVRVKPKKFLIHIF
jgi:lipid A ethanolaminephosphotransferase